MISVTSAQLEAWPSLPLGAWASTRSTLHRWMQIVGKIRLVQTPWLNQSWHATLYVTARGLTTSAIPHQGRAFQIDFNFIDMNLGFASRPWPLPGASAVPSDRIYVRCISTDRAPEGHFWIGSTIASGLAPSVSELIPTLLVELTSSGS